jgi:hypothetical protein
MNKNFIIVGTPRSGTTFVCDVLSQQEGIWLPKYPNYEPFNPSILKRVSKDVKTHVFDQDSIIKKFINYKSKMNSEYFGFKTFTGFHSDLKELIRNNNLDVIIILRKDIWKVIGSMMVAIDNNDYTGSSKKHKPFIFETTFREKRRIRTFFNRMCRTYWELENSFQTNLNIVDKIYFEDLVSNPIRPKLNHYFDRELAFDTKYDDKDDLYRYVENFDEMKKFILDEVKDFSVHYSALPEYILKELEL